MTNETKPRTELQDARYDAAVALRWTQCFDWSVHRANQPHGPCRTCKQPILAEQMYVKIIWSKPWDYEADIDGEGRMVAGAKIGEWGITKDHLACALREAHIYGDEPW